MKKITVSVEEHIHRQAHIRAAEQGTSVSALVRDYLKSLATEPQEKTRVDEEGAETPLERRRRLLRELFADWDARGIGLNMSKNLSREELYDRDALREEHKRFYRETSAS